MFFFSSRRRHTRCLSDWSSDVCSSDLHRLHHVPEAAQHNAYLLLSDPVGIVTLLRQRPVVAFHKRSEERRVGKECRSRWSAGNEKEIVVLDGIDVFVTQSSASNSGRK